MYNLPVAPAFGIFTAPIQGTSISQGSQVAFQLKKNVYNGMASRQIPKSVTCRYDPDVRHLYVRDATTQNVIFSVAGEIVTLETSIFILGEAIEWNYPPNSKSQATSKGSQRNKRSKDEELEKIAEKFDQ